MARIETYAQLGCIAGGSGAMVCAALAGEPARMLWCAALLGGAIGGATGLVYGWLRSLLSR